MNFKILKIDIPFWEYINNIKTHKFSWWGLNALQIFAINCFYYLSSTLVYIKLYKNFVNFSTVAPKVGLLLFLFCFEILKRKYIPLILWQYFLLLKNSYIKAIWERTTWFSTKKNEIHRLYLPLNKKETLREGLEGHLFHNTKFIHLKLIFILNEV